MQETYTLTVGLEIHAELNTRSKMFCGCKNDPHASEPNAHICPICVAHPGTLPAPNYDAIKKVLLVGTAVGGELADYTEFDRKNYFYPDIPKAYQISQYAFPLVRGGLLHGVTLTRIHLEEDTARSQHDKGEESLVDFNRSGVPLMELVTEPVIHSPEDARAFAEELQLLLRTLNVSNANLERGEMRIEANISVSKTVTLGTKVEVKNLNSFKSLEQAIAYEFDRQVATLQSGGSLHQETRGWDESNGKTFLQRSKESAEDYRYFPDPDISRMRLTDDSQFKKSRLEEILPLLPEKKREKYNNLGLASSQIETILAFPHIDSFLLVVADASQSAEISKLAANLLLTDVLPMLDGDKYISSTRASDFVELITMFNAGIITSRVMKDLAVRVLFDNVDPRQYVETNSLGQQSDTTSLRALVAEVVASNPTVIEEYRQGKTNALQFLIGQCMKQSKGTANPQVLRAIFEEML